MDSPYAPMRARAATVGPGWARGLGLLWAKYILFGENLFESVKFF